MTDRRNTSNIGGEDIVEQLDYPDTQYSYKRADSTVSALRSTFAVDCAIVVKHFVKASVQSEFKTRYNWQQFGSAFSAAFD